MKNVNYLGAGIITHVSRKGKLNKHLKDFDIFEAIRKKSKRDTLIGVHKSLDPVLIEEQSDDFELLPVEVKLGNKDVRVISGYGPQEKPFFKALEGEIRKKQKLMTN